MSKTTGAVVEVARKKSAGSKGDVVKLSTGYHAILRPVSILLIQEVQQSVPDPEVPVVEIAEKGRKEPNPNDPEYQQQMIEADIERNLRTLEAVIMFGIEIVEEDGSPFEIDMGDEAQWIRNLKWLGMRGSLDLSEFDMDDPMTREFVFKKFVAVAAPDLSEITKLSGVQEQEVAAAVDKFQHKAKQ